MKMTRRYTGSVYRNRAQRNEFIVKELDNYIGRNILNVGGSGKKYMEEYLPESVDYHEVDIAGEPDIKCNLEQDLPLPVEDGTYETVICTDVLEHLNNIHDVFGELVRVSSKWIIISLPNSIAGVKDWFGEPKENVRGKDWNLHRGKYTKFYGLPYEPPVDRHKWFFSYTEAEGWINYQAEKYNLEICEHFPIGYYQNGRKDRLKRFAVKQLFGERICADLFCSCLWNVFQVKK